MNRIVSPRRRLFRPRLVTGLILSCASMTGCGGAAVDHLPGIRQVEPPARAGSMAPNAVADGDGVLVTWLEQQGSGHGLRAARLGAEGRWSAPRTVVTGDRFFANWADTPGIARHAEGALVAWWLGKSGPGTYAYDVMLAHAAGLESTWQPLGPAHDDGVEAEHGFVSSIPEGTAVRLFWLDGRATHAAGGDDGAMTLRTALVRDAAVTQGELLDPRVCDCCQTSAAMTADGPVVVYRDRTDDEIRDISIVRITARGWSAPAPVHDDGWVVPGCPVNGPSIASVDPAGRSLAVAWFTAEGNRPRVQAAISADAGVTFGTPVLIDDAAPLGRVGIVSSGKEEFVVVWLATTQGEGAAIRLARVRDGATAGTPLTVAETTSSRAGGFPRIAMMADTVFVAWTETGAASRVRAALVPLNMVPEAGRARAVERPPNPKPGVARAWDGRVGSSAPDYAAKDLDGRVVELSSFRGQVLLVNLWATWCAPCRAEMPELGALHQKYGPGGLRVVGISVDVDLKPSEVRAFAIAEKIPYLILHDALDDASRLFTGQQMLPASFLFDKEGVLIWSRVGMMGKDDAALAHLIDDALARGAGASREPADHH